VNSDNPYEVNTEHKPLESNSDSVSSERAAYNTITDIVTGPNIRKKDNVFQAIFILISVAVFAVIGGLATLFSSDKDLPFWAGMLMGGFAGLVIGVFASGIYLMIYRGVRHMKGKHD
jgi:hypothetical protein